MQTRPEYLLLPAEKRLTRREHEFVALTDLYVRLVSTGAIDDPRFGEPGWAFDRAVGWSDLPGSKREQDRGTPAAAVSSGASG